MDDTYNPVLIHVHTCRYIQVYIHIHMSSILHGGVHVISAVILQNLHANLRHPDCTAIHHVVFAVIHTPQRKTR